MTRNWQNQNIYPALKTKREITKYINWQSKKISNDQELIHSDPTVYERHAQQFTKGMRGKPTEQLSQTGGHSAT